MAAFFSHRIFNGFLGRGDPRALTSNGPTLDGAPKQRELTDGKRRRGATPDNEDESPGKKRVRRDSPPRISSLPASSSLRRAGSVKALNLHDANARTRPSQYINPLRSEASVISGRSAVSRGTSTGLSLYLDRVKLQTTSPTPGPEGSHLSVPRAGVSQQSYNVSRPLGSTDMSLDTAVSNFNGGNHLSAQRGLTPTGATFGAMRNMLDSAMSSSGTRTPSRSPKSPTAPSKPIIERHASSGAWAGRAGSVKAPRFGDSSLSRGRTTSLMSMTSAYASSNVSGRAADRTTPTPTDGLSSPPSVTSPATSSVGSPQPALGSPQPSSNKVLPAAVKRAMEALNSPDTPLRQSRSFTNRAPMRNVRVPMPHKKAISFGKSSDAGSSRHTHSQSESGEKSPSAQSHRGHERSMSGPYANGRDQTTGKRILDKRRAEEKELGGSQRSPISNADNVLMEEIDLHVVPIKKGGKESTDPTDEVMEGETISSLPSPMVAAVKPSPARLATISDSSSTTGTSSRTVGRSQLRVGREKTGHQHVHAPSASVTSASTSTTSQAPPPSVSTRRATSVTAPDPRSRIPASEIPSRFNPTMNDRLNRAMSTGRFSLPPDDDDEDTGMINAGPSTSREKEKETQRAQTMGPSLNISVNNKIAEDREKTPERDSSGPTPMNISPVKESYKRSDSNSSDVMSTTPTELSVRGAFSMTPIVQEPRQAAPALPSNPFVTVEAASVAAAGITQPTPPVPFSFGPLNPKPAAIPTLAPVLETKPAAPLPFSFGSAPTPKPAPAPASSGFSFLPAPGATKPEVSGFTSGFTFPPAPSASFAPIPVQPAKADAPTANPFSFAASPLPTIPTLSVSPPNDGAKEAPKPVPFGDLTPSAPTTVTVATEAKPAHVLFSFGQPPVAAEVKPAPVSFSFGQPAAAATPISSTILPASTTPTTPSPVKPAFSFPSTTSALNVSTTPQSSPFSFGSPSHTKPLALGSALELKTPTKENMFSFGAGSGGLSTTPAATPTQNTGFSFGNGKSTTPAVTPAPTPFSFGAPSSSSGAPATPFTFGAAPAASTTPTATPIQTGGFTFSAPSSIKNPFASQSTPTANKSFDFGSGAATLPTTPSFSFGTPGDATPKGKHSASDSFSFGQPASTSNGFSFGAPPTGSNTGAPGLVFPSGPTTPLSKVLELDSMDASPIRGGESATTNGSSFSAANSGTGFSFGASSTNSSGFGNTNAAAPPSGGFGAPNGGLFGSGFGKEASSAPSPSTFSFGGNTLGSGSSGFGQPPASAPFGQPTSSGFGHNSGFSFSQPNSATSASPFNQAQALPSPALGGFAQLSSPAASPFSAPIGLGATNPFGAPQGQKRPSESQGSDAGSQGGDGTRRIAPMPKSRRVRTQAETRNALAKAHGRG